MMFVLLLLLLFAFMEHNHLVAQAQVCLPNGTCDKDERCTVWKDKGQCEENPHYMAQHCPVSCLQQKQDDAVASSTGECRDRHARCSSWSALGECEKNPDVREYCRKSCNTCALGTKGHDNAANDSGNGGCIDTHERCEAWASRGECDTNPRWMHQNCAKSCNTCVAKSGDAAKKKLLEEKKNLLEEQSSKFGVEQRAEGTEMEEILRNIEKSIEYMKTEEVTELPTHILEDCKNRHELCSFWKVIGECERNELYMQTNCGPACQKCHLLDIKTRCTELKDEPPALHPGDLNKMFERIVATAPGNRTLDSPLTDEDRRELNENMMPIYTVTVHSRPSDGPATEISVVQDNSLPPWVITFENLITPEECDEMIELGFKYGYKRSEDIGEQKFDGSYGSVCSTKEGCRELELPQRIHNRLASITGIPANNSEDFQILQYQIGQFYRPHHDYIPAQRGRQCGPRILTFFLYLSDVEAGGGTNFPNLDITIMPKKGRGLLWPSVLDSNPLHSDRRMYHQSMDVVEGTKYAANGRIHMYDYLGPQERGCI